MISFKDVNASDPRANLGRPIDATRVSSTNGAKALLGGKIKMRSHDLPPQVEDPLIERLTSRNRGLSYPTFASGYAKIHGISYKDALKSDVVKQLFKTSSNSGTENQPTFVKTQNIKSIPQVKLVHPKHMFGTFIDNRINDEMDQVWDGMSRLPNKVGQNALVNKALVNNGVKVVSSVPSRTNMERLGLENLSYINNKFNLKISQNSFKPLSNAIISKYSEIVKRQTSNIVEISPFSEMAFTVMNDPSLLEPGVILYVDGFDKNQNYFALQQSPYVVVGAPQDIGLFILNLYFDDDGMIRLLSNRNVVSKESTVLFTNKSQLNSLQDLIKQLGVRFVSSVLEKVVDEKTVFAISEKSQTPKINIINNSTGQTEQAVPEPEAEVVQAEPLLNKFKYYATKANTYTVGDIARYDGVLYPVVDVINADRNVKFRVVTLKKKDGSTFDVPVKNSKLFRMDFRSPTAVDALEGSLDDTRLFSELDDKTIQSINYRYAAPIGSGLMGGDINEDVVAFYTRFNPRFSSLGKSDKVFVYQLNF
jgi:hypothetical protein